MNCTGCGRENRDGARFCDGCGAQFTLRCAQCEAELRDDARFCDACGAPVAETAPAESRKVVTILFADLIGSTPVQERMDAESVRHLMARFYEAMRSTIEEHGGRVAKFIGDAVLAVFGFPTVREDDAERAVRAAAAMVAALPALNDELERQWGVRIGMRTGVNTGEVVESSEELVVGDPVNVAARLEQAAGDGEVLVGEPTWRLVRDKITLEPVEPLDLKGKSEPVTAFRLVSLDPPSAEASAPFVGRADELAMLVATFNRAIADERARIATVIGSPGVGKTRLASELAARVSGGAKVLEARCEPAGTATFAPIADALREGLDIDESASDEAVVDALLSVLPADQSDRERIAARAASVLGAGEPAPPEETFWAVRRIFEALARRRPLVLLLDDVHWAEPMLLDLIEHLADWTRDAPMFLLALARPDIRESRPSLADPGGRDSAVVVLEGLDSEASVQLARDLLDADELPPELTERVLASSEGNPLFLRELLRMLVDDGVLRRDNGSWIVTVDASEVDVPPTIHALLSARIDRLRADERVVVERASVIGKQFYRGAVAALAPAPVASHLDSHLETLRRKELVEPEGTYWIDEPVFRFHHVLIRDAAYRRLLKEARAELHERFAEWLETKAGELVGEHEEVIGYHLEQAHEYRRQLGPLDDSGRSLGVRAAQHLAAAGRRAIERDDLAAAAPLLGRALERLETVDPEILIDRCEALLDLGDVVAGVACVDELSRAANTPRLVAWAECFAAQLANLIDPAHLRETSERAAAAAERFAEIGDAAGAAKAHHVHAETLGRLGQMAASESALDRALAAAREAGDRRRANSVLGGIPFAALWGPNSVARASGRCLDVIRVLRITTGSPAVEARALRCQAVLEALRGRHDAARKMLETSRETLVELGLRHGLLETDVFSGIVELLAGNAAEAEETLREAYVGLTQLGLDADAAYAAALLARSLLSQGRNDEAEQLTHESERLGGEDLRTSILWRAVRGAAISRRGEVDESLRLAREAVALAEATDAVIDHGDARRALGLALGEAGRDAESGAEVARAVELYEAKGATAAADRARGVQHVPATSPAGHRTGSVRAAPGVDSSHVDLWARVHATFGPRDWSTFSTLFHADFVISDVRTGLRSEVTGRDAWVAGLANTYDERSATFDLDIVTTRGRAGIAKMSVFNEADESSGEWETEWLNVYELDTDTDVICRFHYFDADADDAAEALLSEWAPTSGGVFGVRGVDEAHVAFFERLRAALHAHDWSSLRTCQRSDYVVTDLRSGLRSEVVGRDAFVDGLRKTYGSREVDGLWKIVATRGRTGVIEWITFGPGDEVGGPWESRRLSVYALAPDKDVLISQHFFDADAHTKAFALFNEGSTRTTHIHAGPGADPSHIEFWERFRDALAAKRWKDFAALWHDGALYADRRPGLQSEVIGGAEVARVLNESFGAYDFDYEIELLATRGDAGVFLSRFVGRGDERGGPFVAERLVFYVLEDGLVRLGELHEPSERDNLLAKLRLHAPSAAVVDPTHKTFWKRVEHALANKLWEPFAELLHPDVRYLDRRPGLQSDVVGPRDMVRVIRDSYGTRELDYHVEVVATQGDAGVAEALFSGPGDEHGGPWETPRAYFYVLKDDLMAEVVLFNPNDRAEAFALLDEYTKRHRHVHAGPGIGPEHVRRWERIRAPMVAKGWDEFIAVMNPDVALIDHRPGLLAEYRGAENYARALRDSYGMRDFEFDVEILAAEANVNLVVTRWTGPGDDLGGPWETDRFVVTAFDDEERLLRAEIFDRSDDEDARAAFDALAATMARVRAAPGIDAAHVRRWERVRAAMVAKDWDAFTPLMSPAAFVVNDHRSGLLAEYRGANNYARVIRDSYGTRAFDFEAEILAAEGDVDLIVSRWSGPGDDAGGPWETERVAAVAFDDEDRLLRVEMFDRSDVEHATAAFDALVATMGGVRAAPGVGRVHTNRWRPIQMAVSLKDWESLKSRMSPDIVGVDRRPGLRAEYRGPDVYTNALRDAYGDRDYAFEVEVLAADGPMCVARTRWIGHGDALGGPWETSRVNVVVFDNDDLILRVDQFDDAGTATQEFGRRKQLLDGGVRAASRIDAGHADLFGRLRSAAIAKDWPAFAEFWHQQAVYVDHRTGLQSEAIGRDECVKSIRDSYGERDVDWHIEPMASRGNCGVYRSRVHGPGDTTGGPWETERLVVYELARHERTLTVQRFELYEPDDDGSAFSRLRELAGGGVRAAPGVDPIHVSFLVPWRDLLVAKDWEGFASTLHPDARYIDHRSGLQSEVVGREDMIRVIRESYGTRAFDYDIEVLATHGRSAVAVGCVFGGDDGIGGPWETERLVRYEFDDDELVIRRFELFDPSERGAVLAKLRAVEASTGSVRAAPDTDPVHVRFWERMCRVVVQKDWDGLAQLYDPDIDFRDLRPSLRSNVRGREWVANQIKDTYDSRTLDYDVEIWAVRRNAGLARALFFGPGDDLGGPWEQERLAVYELDDAESAITKVSFFERAQREEAFALLAEFAGGGVRAADDIDRRHVSCWERFRSALASHDWDAFASTLDPNLVHNDRRTGLQSEIVGVDTYIRAMRESFGTRVIDYDMEILAVRGNAGVLHGLFFGPGDDTGGPFEAERLVYYELGDDDRFTHFELLDPGDRAAAFALMASDGSSGHVRVAPGANPVHERVWEGVRRAVTSHDWEAFATTVHADVVQTDMRPGLRSETRGREALTRQLRDTYGTRTIGYDVDIIATRGTAGIAVTRPFGSGDELGGPWEQRRYLVYELDDTQDVIARFALVDENRRDEAFAVLCNYAGGGVHASVDGAERFVRAFGRFRADHVAKDWAALRADLEEDFVFVDNRAGLRAQTGPDEYVEAFRHSFGTRDLDADMEVVAFSSAACVLLVRWFGPEDESGGPWETERVVFGVLSADDRFVRGELFDPHDRDAALALLGNSVGVSAPAGADPVHRRVWETVRTIIRNHDWDDYSRVTHADIVVRDMRRGLRSEVVGRDALIRQMRETYDTRTTDYEVDVLAVRKRAALARVRLFGPGDDLGGPWEQPRIFVYELADDKDVATAVSILDLDQLDEAYALLSDIAGGGVRAGSHVDDRFIASLERFRAAFVAKDWDAVASHLHEDLIYVDHQRGLQHEAGREGYLEGFTQSYGSRAVDVDIEILSSHGNASLVHARWFGRGDAAGGAWETDRVSVVVLGDDERFTRLEIFDASERESVLARLHEFAAQPSPTRTVVDRFIHAYNSRDWRALEALIGPDFVHDDHRPLGWGTASGFDELFARIEIGLEESPDAQLGIEWISEQGDVGLFAMPMRGHVHDGGGDFQLDRLMIAVVGGDQLVRLEAFGPDQQDLADERFDALSS